MRIYIRYDLPDEKGETQRERLQRFIDNGGGHLNPPPEFVIPDSGLIYWQWYNNISDGLRRVFDGCCFPIPWSEFRAWSDVAGVIVTADEFAMLRAIDVAFCDEMNKELQAYQERQRRDLEAAHGKK